MDQFLSQLVTHSLGGRNSPLARVQREISSDDDGKQMSGLMQLCDHLNMATPLELASVNVESFVGPILLCLQKEHNPELMLVAARALTYLAESLPHTVSVLSSEEKIQVLLQHILCVQDMELAEQCIACLEKVSHSMSGGAIILRSNGVAALLGFVDFFTVSSQRKIFSILEKVARFVDVDNYSLIAPHFPTIRQFTRHDDGKLRSSAYICIHAVMTSLRKSPDLVADAFGDLAESLMVAVSNADTHDPAFLHCLSITLAGVSLSEQITRRVIESKLLDSFTQLLNATSVVMSPQASPSLHSPLYPSSPNQKQRPSSRLSYEQTKELCNIFAALLVRDRSGTLLYFEDLLHLEVKGSRAAATALAKSSSSADEDGVSEEHAESIEEVSGDEEDEDPIEDIRELLEQSGVTFALKRSNLKCNRGSYSCDGCGKMVVPWDWYRCNECDDCDYCGRCLLNGWQDHYDGTHSFTDMHVLVVSTRAKARTENVQDANKRKMYASDSGLLDAALAAVPCISKLCVESEALMVRIAGLHYLISAVEAAAQTTMVQNGLCDERVCEAIMVSLLDPHLTLNVLAVSLVSKVLTKAPPPVAHLLCREGIAQALVTLSKRYSVPAADPSRPKPPLERQVFSLTGWGRLVSKEAAAQIQRIPSADGATASMQRNLDHIRDLLASDSLPDAADALRSALTCQLTPFELSSHNILHELRAAMLRCEKIDDLLEFVARLSHHGTNEPSPLARFVHHLHTMFSQLDQFQAPAFIGIHSVHTQIPLRLVPHPQRTAASRGKPRRNEEREEDSDSNENNRSIPGPGRVTSVTIEPLATISQLSTFISERILGHTVTARRPMEGTDDDNVEEVLPEVGNVDSPRPAKAKLPGTPSLWLRHNKKVLSLSTTILQLLQELSMPSSNRGKRHTPGAAMNWDFRRWLSKDSPLTLHYSPSPFGQEYKLISSFSPLTKENMQIDLVLPSKESRPCCVMRLLNCIRCEFPNSHPFLTAEQQDILAVLGALHEIVLSQSELLAYCGKTCGEEGAFQLSTDVKPPDFIHQKLSNKAMRHLSSMLLAGQQASTWAVNLVKDCTFLFTTSARKFFFEISFCGTFRSLVRVQNSIAEYGLQDHSSTDHVSPRRAQLLREKKRVWRDRPLDCAMALMGDQRPSGAAIWEFEFYGEVGSGLGPTREFYTLVSQALRERAPLRLWCSSGEAEGEKYFIPPNGLYPCLMAATADTKERERYFRFIGRFIARAMLDGHVTSLSLSPLLLKLLRGDTCSAPDVHTINADVGNVLMALIESHKADTDVVTLPAQKKGFHLKDMGLTFTAPGTDAVDLIPSGGDTDVTRDNVTQYCDALVDFMLRVGVTYAVTAMREGFNDYIPLSALCILTVEELNEVIFGFSHAVTRKEFEENSLADHGFTVTCSHVQWLFDILDSFDVEEQKKFFIFVTGSPHLPVGGLASLRPKLTIVRKTSSEPSVKETDQLPSAMTCQHYLKLPAYESKQRMEEKLRQAINEGTGSFFLT